MPFEHIQLSTEPSLPTFQLTSSDASNPILNNNQHAPAKGNGCVKGKRKVCNKGMFRLLEENCRNIGRVILDSKRNHESNLSYFEEDELKNKVPKKQNKGISKLIVQKPHKPKSLEEELTSYSKSSSELEFSESTIIRNETLSQLSTKSKNITKNGEIVTGGLGHSSIVFQNELIEGDYILEMRVMEPQPLNCIHEPHIRVGICGSEHPLDTPLGYGKSIGFNLLKGSFVAESKTQESDILCLFPKIHEGDMIRVHTKFSPEYKRPNDELLWEESMLEILINGKLIGRYNGIKQMKYYPAISLYNGARVELIGCGSMGVCENFEA